MEETEIQRKKTTEQETEIQLELEQIPRYAPAQIEPVQTRAPAPVPQEQRHERKIQQQPRGAAIMDDGSYCKETESNIIGTQDGARVLRPRTAATSYQVAEPTMKRK